MTITKGVRNRCAVVQKFILEKQPDLKIYFFYLKYESFMMNILLDSDFRIRFSKSVIQFYIYFIIVKVVSQILFFSMVKVIVRNSRYINSLLSTYY